MLWLAKESQANHEVAVLVVNISMIPAAMVHAVLGHSDFWPVEHWWLIHVIPDEQILRGALIVGQAVARWEVVPHCRVHYVQVTGGTWPAPTCKYTFKISYVGLDKIYLT